MSQVLIRNIPDGVIDSFKTKAKLAGKPMEQILRDLIVAHARLSSEEKIALSKYLHSLSPGVLQPLSKDEYREGLE